MGKEADIIRLYSEVEGPISEFGPWLLSEIGSREKEMALSDLWIRFVDSSAADNPVTRRAKLDSLMKRIPQEDKVTHHRLLLPLAIAAGLALLMILPNTLNDGLKRPLVAESIKAVGEFDKAIDETLDYQKTAIQTSVDYFVAKSSDEPIASYTASTTIDDIVDSSGIETSPDSKSSLKSISDEPKGGLKLIGAQSEKWDVNGFSPGENDSHTISLGIHTSGGLMPLNSAHLVGIPGGTDGQSENAQPSARVHNQYDIPMKIGLQINFPLNQRFSLMTGVNLTALHTSSSIESSSVNAVREHFRYIYLGVPLLLRYQLSSGRAGNLYGFAGASVDYCLRGWSGGKVFDEHPLQMSACAGFGYEFTVTRALGLFGELSLDYYFPDNSELDTYYKNSPLAPALSFGVHYNINY